MDEALVRDVAATFDEAIVGAGGRQPDVELARRQHAVYRAHLEEAGYSVTTVAADDTHPDCVFIEDTAVIVGDVAVITRPGAESRRAETRPVAAALAGSFRLVDIEAPGTLDGGDVMILGRTLWVGRSDRTNDVAIDQLREVAAGQGLDVVAVPVTGALHLKSGVLPVGPETVVVTKGTVDETLFAPLEVLVEDPGERLHFSALPLRTGRVLVTDAAPKTARIVESRGIEVLPIDVSEILAADGGLTCMSILF